MFKQKQLPFFCSHETALFNGNFIIMKHNSQFSKVQTIPSSGLVETNYSYTDLDVEIVWLYMLSLAPLPKYIHIQHIPF